MYFNIREEEIKNKVAKDWFTDFDCTSIIGNIDFCVLPKTAQPLIPALLWAEAKTGSKDIVQMFAQLILTIGKARTYTKHQPPAFLGVFDSEKIAFVAYKKIAHLFSKNDFNWNVTPSNYSSKEFKEIEDLITNQIARSKYQYFFRADEKALKRFIKNNLATASSGKQQIDKNNFVPIYLRWLDVIKPLIDVDFDAVKSKYGILDSDFYLADLFMDDNNSDELNTHISIKESLYVVFAIVIRNRKEQGEYEIRKENLVKDLFGDDLGDRRFKLKDIDKYTNFWQIYKRPPADEYHKYILERRDLLVPQDIRERKGAFFTPKIWSELSKKYLSDYLGDDWQDEYYIWDCCAGTGNLLAGLTNRRNIWASTLDNADVLVMKEIADKEQLPLFKDHIFQFDFLNDDFEDQVDAKTGQIIKKSKIPANLQEIIKDNDKRAKLIIYINPPYAEAGNAKTPSGYGENKANTATNNKTYEKYKGLIGKASNELFAQFLIRIYKELPHSTPANFSKLKNLQGSNFAVFKKNFPAKLEKLFLMNADSFDNVKGQFPIGFFIWNTKEIAEFTQIIADVYESTDKDHKNRNKLPSKIIYSYSDEKRINDWLVQYKTNNNVIGCLIGDSPDFQHNKQINIASQKPSNNQIHMMIDYSNLIPVSIYLSVRLCIPATWLNDRDQFLYPDNSWEKDFQFHNDCLAFTLFHGQNRISCLEGINHWLPFTEDEVKAQAAFTSNFMSEFLKGKNPVLSDVKNNQNNEMNERNETSEKPNQKRQLQKTQASMFETEIPAWQKPQIRDFSKPSEFISPEAVKVFQAGKLLWQFYHQHPYKNEQTGVEFNVNASLYDIRAYFQGRNAKGKMNNKSENQEYNTLISNLREQLQILADKIAVQVYEHGFLKR